MNGDHRPPPPLLSFCCRFKVTPCLVSETTSSEQRADDKDEVSASLQWLPFKTLHSLIFSERHVLFVTQKLSRNLQKLAVSLEMSLRCTQVCFRSDGLWGEQKIETNNPTARRTAALSDTLLCFLFACGRGRIFGKGKTYGSRR